MVIDIVLIVIFVLMLLYGGKKGIIGIVAKLISAILAFVLACVLADVVGKYVSNTNIGIEIQNNISEFVIHEIEDKEQSSVLQIVQDKLNVADEQKVVFKIAQYVFKGIGFISVFIIARIILWIGQKILESVFELPVLKTFNKLGGVIASGLLFIIEVSIILAAIECISTLTFMSGMMKMIGSSVITKALYEHNIFTTIILSKIF